MKAYWIPIFLALILAGLHCRAYSSTAADGRYFGQSENLRISAELKSGVLLIERLQVDTPLGKNLAVFCSGGFAFNNRITVSKQGRFGGSCSFTPSVADTGRRMVEGVFPNLVLTHQSHTTAQEFLHFEVALVPESARASFLADLSAGVVKTTAQWVATSRRSTESPEDNAPAVAGTARPTIAVGLNAGRVALAPPDPDKDEKELLRRRLEEQRREKEQALASEQARAAAEAVRLRAEADARLAAEVEAARLRQQALEQRLAAETRERERLVSEARERERREAEVSEGRDARERERERQQAQFSTPARPPVAPRQERRLALVIGNAAYATSPLENPVNDAVDIEGSLRRSGFETVLLRNASLAQMREATRRFAERLPMADVALIYFAGHGIESRGRNYMIPVSANLKFEFELPEQGYDAGTWLEMLETVRSVNADRVNIVILDACRNNSLLGARSLGRGLGRLDTPSGTFLAYSTSPGQVAADGTRGQRNSPFTRHLLRAMEQPNRAIEEVFKEVRRQVRSETGGAQIPWESTSLTGFFAFRRSP